MAQVIVKAEKAWCTSNEADYRGIRHIPAVCKQNRESNQQSSALNICAAETCINFSLLIGKHLYNIGLHNRHNFRNLHSGLEYKVYSALNFINLLNST